MSKQLKLLEKAIETGRDDFRDAMLVFAPHTQHYMDEYGHLPNATPLGWTSLSVSTNPDIKAYLDFTREEGNENDEMDRYVQLTIEVLQQDGQYPKLVTEFDRILKDGL